MTSIERPIDASYWVIDGQLVAGQYPGSHDPATALAKVRHFIDAGITCFIDLTHPDDDLAPYVACIEESGSVAVHHPMPIVDMDVTSPAHMAIILDTIDDVIGGGGKVYVHCLGGLGRTGTVIGCYLVRHGMDGQQALREIQRLRTGAGPYFRQASPQTEAQRSMVQWWSLRDPKLR